MELGTWNLELAKRMESQVQDAGRSPEIRQIQEEFRAGRWCNIPADLGLYLTTHSTELMSDALDEVLRLKRLTRDDLRAAVREGRPEGDEILSGAAVCHLVRVRTIASKDEYEEQLRGLRDAIWFEGENLRRGLTKEETESIIRKHLEVDPPGFRDHIVHVILYVFRERRGEYLPLLREAFLTHSPGDRIWPGAI